MTIVFTQIGSATANAAATTLVIPNVTCAINDIIVVMLGASNNGGTTGLSVTGITDNSGSPNTYSGQSQGGRTTNTWICQIWTAKCTNALSNNSITITFGQSIDDRVAYIYKATGCDTTSWVDKSAITGSSGGPTYSLVSGTLVQNEEIIIGGWTVGDDKASTDGGPGTLVSFNGGWTRIASLGSLDGAGIQSCRIDFAYQIVAATTTQTESMTLGGSKSAAGAMISLKGSSISPPVNTVLPVILCGPQVGLTAATDNGSWSNTPTSYSYQWQRADDLAFTTSVTSIGTNSSSFTLTSSEQNKFVRCQVTAINTAGSATANSNIIGSNIGNTGIVASTSGAVRLVCQYRNTDHAIQTPALSDHVPINDSIFITTCYSVDTNSTASIDDTKSNSYVQDEDFSTIGEVPPNSTVDVWRSLNVAHAIPSGTSISMPAAGTGALGPSDSVLVNIISVTPPAGKQLVFDKLAHLAESTTNTSHTSGTANPTVAISFLLGAYVQSGDNSPVWTATGSWTELWDYGDTTDPTKQTSGQFQFVNSVSAVASTGTSSASRRAINTMLIYSLTGGVTLQTLSTNQGQSLNIIRGATQAAAISVQNISGIIVKQVTKILSP